MDEATGLFRSYNEQA